MSAKTIFIIAVTAAVTLILVNNTDNMELWLFGKSQVPKLGIFGALLAAGFILGFMAGRPSTRKTITETIENQEDDEEVYQPPVKKLSDEDKEYIS